MSKTTCESPRALEEYKIHHAHAEHTANLLIVNPCRCYTLKVCFGNDTTRAAPSSGAQMRVSNTRSRSFRPRGCSPIRFISAWFCGIGATAEDSPSLQSSLAQADSSTPTSRLDFKRFGRTRIKLDLIVSRTVPNSWSRWTGHCGMCSALVIVLLSTRTETVILSFMYVSWPLI